jgi:hypothetical protein
VNDLVALSRSLPVKHTILDDELSVAAAYHAAGIGDGLPPHTVRRLHLQNASTEPFLKLSYESETRDQQNAAEVEHKEPEPAIDELNICELVIFSSHGAFLPIS